MIIEKVCRTLRYVRVRILLLAPYSCHTATWIGQIKSDGDVDLFAETPFVDAIST